MLIETPEDVVRSKSAGFLGKASISKALAVDDMPELVERYYALGIRSMLLAYNKYNAAGGGCLDEDQGLTPLGRRAIDEVERCGMVLDLSHTGYRPARDVVSNAVVMVGAVNPNAPDERRRRKDGGPERLSDRAPDHPGQAG